MISKNKYLRYVLSRFFGLSPIQRRLFIIAADSILLPFAVWLSFWLRLPEQPFSSFVTSASWLLLVVWLVGLPLYALSGQYQGLTRYVGSRSLYQLALRNCLLVLTSLFIGWLLRLPMPPRSSWFLLWLLLTGFTGAVRFCLRDVIWSFERKPQQRIIRVAIYGAGSAGVQLSAALPTAVATFVVGAYLDGVAACHNVVFD